MFLATTGIQAVDSVHQATGIGGGAEEMGSFFQGFEVVRRHISVFAAVSGDFQRRMTFLFSLMCGRWPCWSLLLSGLLTAAELVAPASAQPQVEASPIRMLLEKGAGRLPWIYDGIRHVELPLAEGRAVIGLSCDRQTWTLF